MKKKLLSALLVLSVLSILNSCLDLSTDIQMKKDGSGKVSMEYRIPSMAESIGRLDGNEQLSILAISRSDWERTINRHDGIKLVSFSSRERADEIITGLTLEYDNMDALLSILDPTGAKSSFSQNRLDIVLIEPVSAALNPDLLELLRQASSGKKFKMSFSAETNANLTFFDGTLKEIPPPSGCEIVSSGKKVSFSIDTAQLLSITNGLGISIRL